MVRKHFRVSQPSVPFSQKSYTNNTWECQSVTYLNYEGAKVHGRNSPAALEQHIARWGKYYIHTACCTTCTIRIPSHLHLMLQQVLWAWTQTWAPPCMALLGCLQGKKQGTNVRCWWKRVNCLERAHGSFKPVEVQNYIFRSDHFNSR